jgi:hypothetical protein
MQTVLEKISLSKCKSILQKDGSVYTDDEILEIRDFLYKLAEMDYEVFLKMKIRDMEFEKSKEAENNNSETEIKQAA